MIYVDIPYAVDGRGLTKLTTAADHLSDLIFQILFTSPGERVNRPRFGCGLPRHVFEPNSQIAAAGLRVTILSNLQQEMSELIEPREVEVEVDDATLSVTVSYAVRRTGEERTATFVRPLT
jgi:phage baseplate assembly protein W